VDAHATEGTKVNRNEFCSPRKAFRDYHRTSKNFRPAILLKNKYDVLSSDSDDWDTVCSDDEDYNFDNDVTSKVPRSSRTGNTKGFKKSCDCPKTDRQNSCQLRANARNEPSKVNYEIKRK